MGYVALFVVWASSSLMAQEITYEQQMDDLEAKATALSKRLEDSEARSQRMNAFVAQARERLEALRAGRAAGEPIQMPEQTAPSDLGENPNPAIAEPGSQQPVTQELAKLRKRKGYYLQAFGGYLLPRTVNMKTNIGKVPIEPKEGFSTGLVFGRDFRRFRLEGEISGRQYDHDTMDLSHPSAKGPGHSKEPVNGYTSAFGGVVTALVDFPLTDDSGLFVGVGVGVNGATLKLENRKFKNTLFAYQLLSGFEWEFTERASLRFLYKYFTTAGSKDFDRLDSHNLELGMQVDL